MGETYRNYLQRWASNPNATKNERNQAQALLNVVGDDGTLDERFTSQQVYNAPGVFRSGTKSRGNWTRGGDINYGVDYTGRINSGWYKAYVDEQVAARKNQQSMSPKNLPLSQHTTLTLSNEHVKPEKMRRIELFSIRV